MQEDRYDHRVSGPPVQISQNFSVENEGQGLHIEIGPFSRRRVMEHQENAGDRQNNEEEARDPPQAEGIGESETMAFDLNRENMEEEVVVDQQGPLQVRIRYSGPEDGTPKCRICDALDDPFFHQFNIPQICGEQGKKDGLPLSNRVRQYPPCRRQMDDGTPPW